MQINFVQRFHIFTVLFQATVCRTPSHQSLFTKQKSFTISVVTDTGNRFDWKEIEYQVFIDKENVFLDLVLSREKKHRPTSFPISRETLFMRGKKRGQRGFKFETKASHFVIPFLWNFWSSYFLKEWEIVFLFFSSALPKVIGYIVCVT